MLMRMDAMEFRMDMVRLHRECREVTLCEGKAECSPPSQQSRDRSQSGGDLAKRANRDMPVYQASQYAKNITDSVSSSY